MAETKAVPAPFLSKFLPSNLNSRSTRRHPHWLEGLPALDFGMLLIIVGRRIAVQHALSRMGFDVLGCAACFGQPVVLRCR
jgi:hypothetical protein